MYFDGIEELINNSNRVVDEFLPTIVDYLEAMAGGSDKKGSSKHEAGSIEAVLESIKSVDKEKVTSLNELFNTLSNSALAEKVSNNSENLGRSISGLSSAINRIDLDKDKVESVEQLASSAMGLVGVSRALTLSAPFLIAGAVLSFLLIPMVWGISKAFSMLSPDTIGKMDKGGDALKKVGWSLAIFAGGVALSVALMGYAVMSNPVALLSLFAVIGLSALTFALVGRYNENIVDGAWTVVGMSLSLMLFSFSVKVANSMLQGVGLQNMMNLGLILAGTGIVYWLLGKFAPNILWGSLAVAAMGLSLMLIANPLSEIGGVVAKNGHILWQLPVLLGGLGVVFALAGLASPLILMGSLAMGAMGGSLWAIGKGMQAMAKVKDFDGEMFKESMTGLIEGFSAMSWKDAISIPFKLPAIISIAMALGTIGIGMGIYKRNADWSDEDADQFAYTIRSFVRAFSMKGVDWDTVEDAIDATWYMGKNLQRLAKGISAWEDIDFDIELVKNNITRILTTIPTIFAKVGDLNKGGMEIFGFTFARGAVEDGIESTMNLGNNLINLAKGIKSWETIKFDVGLVRDNVSKVLTTIPSVFAELGVAQTGGKPLYDMWGNEVGKEMIEAGVDATLEMGKTLGSLSRGVIAWKNVKMKDVWDSEKKIKAILLAIPSIFARIGMQAKASEGIFSDSNHIKGAEVVSSFTKPIKSIATLVASFKGQDIDSTKVERMITGIFSALGRADKLIPKKAMKTLYGVSGVMHKMGKDWPKFNKGLKQFADIISKLGKDQIKSFLMIATSIEKMAKIKEIEVKLQQGSNSVAKSIINEVGGTGLSNPAVKKQKEEEKKEEEKRKKMPIDQQMLAYIKDLVELQKEGAEVSDDIKQDLEDLKNLFLNGNAKVKTSTV